MTLSNDPLAGLAAPPRLMRAAVGVRGPSSGAVMVSDERFARSPDVVTARLAPAIAGAVSVSVPAPGVVSFDAHLYDEATGVTVASVRLSIAAGLDDPVVHVVRSYVGLALAMAVPVTEIREPDQADSTVGEQQ